MSDQRKILARSQVQMDYEQAAKFLDSTGHWDRMTHEERQAFCKEGIILDTVECEKLLTTVAKLGAEEFLINKHGGRPKK